MDRIFVVKIIHEKNNVFKNLWSYASKEPADKKRDEYNAKGFKEVRYETEEVRFQDDEINEDDF